MSVLRPLESGSRYDLREGLSPDAPDESEVKDEEGSFGYCHSYETSSRYDGPGLRAVLFVSGCLLRCTYCHNPDTWHLKDGTYVSLQQVLDRLGSFAPTLVQLGGGLTISGGEPMVQLAFTRRIFQGAKAMACIRRSRRRDFWAIAPTSRTCRRSILFSSTSRARTPTPIAGSPAVIWRRRFASRSGLLRSRSQSGSVSRWFPAKPTIPRMSRASPDLSPPCRTSNGSRCSPSTRWVSSSGKR